MASTVDVVSGDGLKPSYGRESVNGTWRIQTLEHEQMGVERLDLTGQTSNSPGVEVPYRSNPSREVDLSTKQPSIDCFD